MTNAHCPVQFLIHRKKEMNFNLNLHNVTKITLGPVRLYRGADTYATRQIEIETTEGTFEVSLFSPHVSEEDYYDDKPFLEVNA